MSTEMLEKTALSAEQKATSRGRGEEKGRVRYTIEFPKKVLQDLNFLSEEEGVTKAEIFRSALALYAYLYKEAKSKGLSLAILDETKKVLREVVFT
jgi:hypothetical protein